LTSDWSSGQEEEKSRRLFDQTRKISLTSDWSSGQEEEKSRRLFDQTRKISLTSDWSSGQEEEKSQRLFDLRLVQQMDEGSAFSFASPLRG
jgi:hypothetical protein